MNPLTQTINQTKMNERELEMGIAGTKGSWHMEYKDSAWIFLGGLPYEMTEGDVICMFSQYGEVVHINLIRDHTTGKSKGFGFLCYMDQRSTILAVDNLNGVKVLKRMIRVDHIHQYKLPKDLEKLDQDKRKLFEEGCAPKEIEAELSESSEEEYVSKPKKRKVKKEKKKKKKRRHSTSSNSESSEDYRRNIRNKDTKEANGSGINNGREYRSIKEEKSLEERLRDMSDYVRKGETQRLSAKEMFEEDRRSNVHRDSKFITDKPRRNYSRSRSRETDYKAKTRKSRSRSFENGTTRRDRRRSRSKSKTNNKDKRRGRKYSRSYSR